MDMSSATLDDIRAEREGIFSEGFYFCRELRVFQEFGDFSCSNMNKLVAIERDI